MDKNNLTIKNPDLEQRYYPIIHLVADVEYYLYQPLNLVWSFLCKRKKPSKKCPKLLSYTLIITEKRAFPAGVFKSSNFQEKFLGGFVDGQRKEKNFTMLFF